MNDGEFRVELESLVLPEADAAVTAGKLLENLPRLWEKADLGERRRILLTMLDAVYVDTVEKRRIVAIRPRPAFRPLFEVATTREDSGIVLVSERDLENANQPPPGGHEADGSLCSWWRRGRVELYLKHGLPILLAACATVLSGSDLMANHVCGFGSSFGSGC